MRKNAKNYTVKTNSDNLSVMVTETNEHGYISIIKIEVTLDYTPLKIKNLEYSHYRYLGDDFGGWTAKPLEYITEESLNAGLAQVQKNFKAVKKIIRNAQNHPAYSFMVDKAKKYLKHFESDFTYHDAKRLGTNSAESFLWVLRESGTWFLSERKGSKDILEYSIQNNQPTVYYYNGEFIQAVNYREAMYLLDTLK